MTSVEEKYGDILKLSRPEDPAVFQKHPRMTLQDRAKIFSPFAALRGHDDRLAQETEKLLRSSRRELSGEEITGLSAKLSQASRGMDLTIVRFLPDAPGSQFGYYVPLSGRIVEIDRVHQILKITTGEKGPKGLTVQSIRFDELAEIRFS